MTITAIIPTYNKEMYIGSIILKTKKYVDRVIIVDEDSTDKTVEISLLAEAEIIKYSKNKEIGDILKTDLYMSSKNGEKIITVIDTNYRDVIDKIPEVIDHIKNGYDIVVRLYDNKLQEKIIFPEMDDNIKLEFLAISIESLNRISYCKKLDNLTSLNGSSVKNILYYAEKNNLNIKYLDNQKESDLIFNDYNIGVVVPAYNEEILIKDTINGIPGYIKKIYIIDDGSTDNTYEIIKNINDSRIICVKHENNRGVGAAIITGYKLALKDDIDIVVVMAGDNQMDPIQIPRLIMPIIENKADYTKGNRLISKNFRQGMSKWRFFGNAMLTMITKIGSGHWHITDPQNGYTAISRKALKLMDLDSIYPYYGYCNDILIKLNTLGMRVEDVAIPARYGNEKSKIKYTKFIRKVAPMIFIGFLWRLKTKYMILDFHPLVFFYLASTVLLPSGILLSLWILFQKMYHNYVSPNFPLLAVFITLMGLQLLLFAMFFDMQNNKINRYRDI